jgi:hypothetical protein
MKINYINTSKNILKNLNSRAKDVLEKRFGLKGSKRTLDSIGREYNVTRERIRQIEKESLLNARKTAEKKHKNVFSFFNERIKEFGGLKEEMSLVRALGSEKEEKFLLFLLNLSPDLKRVKESEEFFAFWTVDKKSFEKAKKVCFEFEKVLRKEGKPLPLKKLNSKGLKEEFLSSYLEVFKGISTDFEGNYGLSIWPEVNPRGIKDKAYLALRKIGSPLHFSEVAKSISSNSHIQTVHNELIRDSRFVLVGRGMYALKEWGYKEGTVRDIIMDVMKKKGRPIARTELIKDVSKQRFVKENTILLNLSNRKYFQRDPKGKYQVRLT